MGRVRARDGLKRLEFQEFIPLFSDFSKVNRFRFRAKFLSKQSIFTPTFQEWRGERLKDLHLSLMNQIARY
jgi:hypothetical protein